MMMCYQVRLVESFCVEGGGGGYSAFPRSLNVPYRTAVGNAGRITCRTVNT